MQIQDSYELSQLNTLHLKSVAKHFVKLTDTNQIAEIIDFATKNNLSYLVLGGGSNLVLPKFYSGLVIHNQLLGIERIADDVSSVLVRVMAGEIWDDFVLYTLQHGWFGLENLSLIPGTVGASPIQNIGAYGAEVKDFIEYVEIYDVMLGKFSNIPNSECMFSYRNSRFKQSQNYIVTAVVFRLNLVAKLNMSYVDVQRKLSSNLSPSAIDLRNCVVETRQSKLPDPKVIGNVGSFFHNPILKMEKVQELLQQYQNLPVYKIDDSHAKVSAGWLIDNLGLKGYRMGNVGVYIKQALVLVNHGGADANDILKLAKFIQDQVLSYYAIALNIEPIVIK